MSPRSGRRPRRRRKKLDSEVEGDAFLLQVSVILCTVAALAWSLLQVVLYQGTEPQMVAIPLLYPAVVFPTAWYERYRLHRLPYKHLARVHLMMVCVLPALLQIETGGFARSGGVISWSSVSPFTACVIAKKISKAWNWGALWMAVIALAYGYEAYNETHDRHGAGLIAQAWHSDESFHVVRVWTWQIYFYALATKVGVTLNACLLMYLLRNKTDNAVQAHKMLACAIMPPPVAKEVFEIQWKRLRDGRRASKASKAATSTPGRVSAASRVLNCVFGNSVAGSNGSQSGYRSSSVSSRSSGGWSWGGIGRGEQRPGAARSRSDDSHHSTHSDGTGSSHDGAFEWTNADYNDTGLGSARLRELAQRMDSSSSTKAELAADTTRALADFAEQRPSPPRRSLDDVKLDIPEDDIPEETDTDDADGADADASVEATAHKELQTLRQVSFSGTLATERVFERSGDSFKGLQLAARSSSSRRHDRQTTSTTTARDHPSVTVIFIDIVGFSEMCEHVKPKAVLRFLEHYFELVDKMAEEHGVTKVRTVGDGYLAVTGLMAEMGVPEDSHQHVLRSLTFGLGVLLELRDVGLKLPTGRPVQARIGLADGNVFSGVVGKTCMQYDIFGNVANLAARMEQTSPYDGVHMPESSFEKMMSEMSEEQRALFEKLAWTRNTDVEIKNMGKINTASLELKGNEDQIERVVAGCISDDTQRAVTMHIGAMQEAFRQLTWESGGKIDEGDEEAEFARRRNLESGDSQRSDLALSREASRIEGVRLDRE